MSIDIAIETTDERLDAELQAMAPLHWQEFADERDTHPLSVNVANYRKMYNAGMLYATTARRDGELVGYQLLYMLRHLHRDVLTVNDAVTFIRPDIPNRWFVLVRMVNATIAEAKRRGALEIRLRVKLDHNYGPLLDRLGFKPVELAYSLNVRN